MTKKDVLSKSEVHRVLIRCLASRLIDLNGKNVGKVMVETKSPSVAYVSLKRYCCWISFCVMSKVDLNADVDTHAGFAGSLHVERKRIFDYDDFTCEQEVIDAIDTAFNIEVAEPLREEGV